MIRVLDAGLKVMRGKGSEHLVRPAGYWLLVHTVSGNGRWGEAEASSGTVLLVGLEVPRRHTPSSIGSWEFQWLRMFTPPDWAPPSAFHEIASRLFEAHVQQSFVDQRLSGLFANVASDLAMSQTRDLVALTAAGEQPDASPDETIRTDDLLIQSSVDQIFLLLERERSTARGIDPRIADVLLTMAEDHSSGHSVGTLAASVDLSPSRFAHLFTGEMHMSPMQALRSLRTSQVATRLVATDDTLDQIAAETGFRSRSELYRAFKRRFGVSPDVYRRGSLGRDPRVDR